MELMPLRRYKCPLCKYERETLRNRVPLCNHGQEEEGEPIPVKEMAEILSAPQTKMMEKSDAFKGKSRPKDLNKTLKERTRNYARDHEADDMISLNERNNLERSGFLNKDGKRRRKVDDI